MHVFGPKINEWALASVRANWNVVLCVLCVYLCVFGTIKNDIIHYKYVCTCLTPQPHNNAACLYHRTGKRSSSAFVTLIPFRALSKTATTMACCVTHLIVCLVIAKITTQRQTTMPTDYKPPSPKTPSHIVSPFFFVLIWARAAPNRFVVEKMRYILCVSPARALVLGDLWLTNYVDYFHRYC